MEWEDGRSNEGAGSDRGVYGGCVVVERVPDGRPGWMWRGGDTLFFRFVKQLHSRTRFTTASLKAAGAFCLKTPVHGRHTLNRGRDSEDRKGGDENQLPVTHQCYGAVGDGDNGVFYDRDQKR